MLKKFMRMSWLVAMGLLFVAGRAHAVLDIEITQGVESALPIAVSPFGWDEPASPPLDFAAIINSDLRRSGIFSPLPEKDFLARPRDAAQVNFLDWKILGAANLVIGKISRQGGGYAIQFQLFDVFKGVQLTGYSVHSNEQDLRRTAHQISDIIFETITGIPGAFATRIAYVTATTSGGTTQYSLLVADADGDSPRPVLNSRQPILSPSWSPDGSTLAYVSFESGRPAIYTQEIASGKRDRIAAFSGLNGAPAWSPNGKELALVLSKDGNPDIYVMTLGTGQLRRITDSFAIDTEPAWTPDGRSIIFTSDRGGKPQIYRVSSRGGSAERLTYEGTYNARPGVSPDGKLVAMVHAQGGNYRVAILELATKTLRVLTKGRLDESPSFAPNGSMVIYATEDRNRGVLAAVSVDGRVHQRLSEQRGEAREPAWSPFRQ
ncbi:MAG: TolB protein [Gammaproteobacteria bacterium]|nr:MAG: TolB protein [Gammaproteobacteria bacterium]TND04281.1 MAG: TolB protein [Gammaproteobacteria bacterium]